MSQMKYSGNDLIKEIPIKWNVSRLKFFSNIKSGENISADEYKDDGEFQIIGANGSIGNYDKYNIDKPKIITGRVGTLGTFRIEKKAWISDNCLIIESGEDLNYLKYLLESLEIELLSTSTAQPLITATKLGNVEIVLPINKEQKMISTFLNHEEQKINDVLENLNKQIEILDKYKMSLITETVTKGLNQNAEMKDSGIDWIRNIPKHWSVNRINNICKLKGRIGWQGLTTDEYIDEGPYLITGVDFFNGSIDWNNCEHVSEWRYNQATDIQIKENDLLITKDGTVGKIAIVQKCPEKVTLNSGVLLIRSINNAYINKFLYYILYSNEFWHWFEITNLGATTITHLYQNVFAKFLVAMPDKKEQQEIVHYLDNKCEEIDTLIKDKQEQIEKIEQYKKSLIYEYVTGKKRVKGAEELYG